MKIGIQKSNKGFSTFWIKYCEKAQIPYKIVDCYANDILKQLEDCDGLMWHHHQGDYRDLLFAKSLLFSLEQSGKKVFPDFNTAWHFDDKAAQKYLLESLGAPTVPSYLFYDKKSALKWINETTFPKVFKLTGGAGSANVKLIKNKAQAVKLVNKSFGKGFRQYDIWTGLKERLYKFRSGKGSFKSVLGGIYYIFKPYEFIKMARREKGYFYAQEFIPNNDSDIRIIVVKDKAFAIKRMVRKNDFRASGSGEILYAKENFSDETLKISFEVSKKMKSQSAAFDFVYDEDGNPLLVEVSYGFNSVGYDDCVGYWNNDLSFVEGSFNPYNWMVENLIKSIDEK
jgi:glutathione synthase/RimK-type ligase-like ATP-grasp enzyme